MGVEAVNLAALLFEKTTLLIRVPFYRVFGMAPKPFILINIYKLIITYSLNPSSK